MPVPTIDSSEIQYSAVRSSGPGGQHVNKVATAVQLRFDIHASSLPPLVKQRLCDYPDRRISRDGVIVIKAQRYRSQDQNRLDAENRLNALLTAALTENKPRIPTRPTPASRTRRLRQKQEHAQKKLHRTPVNPADY